MASPMDQTCTVDDAAWLTSPAGQAAITAAGELPDSLAGLTVLRTGGLSPEHASAAMTQASLRRLAHDRYGIEGAVLLTRDGLEQATRPEVAERRARWLAEAGVTRIIDATAGLGFDARAFARAGMHVTAVETDPSTAAFARHNAPEVDVREGDAVQVLAAMDLTGAVVFVDPARRDHRRSSDGSRAHPERDPERWSPPWSWVQALAERTRVCAKVASGFRVPSGWQATWTSVDRTVVDCFVTSWPLAGADTRAVVIRRRPLADTTIVELKPSARLPVAASVRAYLHEPDPAIVRAGVIDSLDGDLLRVDEVGTWLTSDHEHTSTELRSYRVVAELTGDRKHRRRELAARGIRQAVVKTGDVETSPAAVLRDLGISEGPGAVIIACRASGHSTLILAES